MSQLTTPANAHLFTTTSSRHHALHTRNPLAHSAFIYSVITTRIYCRPTCPSRLARRSNIIFHSTPAEAAAAGFRPCKRCTPEIEGDVGQVKIVRRACALIDEEVARGEKTSVKALAREIGLTESHFCRVFKKVTGLTVGEYRSLVQAEREDQSSGMTETPRTLESCGVGSGWDLQSEQDVLGGTVALESLPLSPSQWHCLPDPTENQGFETWDEFIEY